jgi:hypothetical protein
LTNLTNYAARADYVSALVIRANGSSNLIVRSVHTKNFTSEASRVLQHYDRFYDNFLKIKNLKNKIKNKTIKENKSAFTFCESTFKNIFNRALRYKVID